jgi:hypothetical protein
MYAVGAGADGAASGICIMVGAGASGGGCGISP